MVGHVLGFLVGTSSARNGIGIVGSVLCWWYVIIGCEWSGGIASLI